MQDKIIEVLKKEIQTDKEQDLTEILKDYRNGSIGIVQLNPIVGNIEHNANKIVKHIKLAQKIGLETIIFPELALTGSPLEDILTRYSFLADECTKWINEIAKITTKTTAFVGFIEFHNNIYYNSVAILKEGKILEVIRKPYIPKYLDSKELTPTKYEQNKNIVQINNKKYGIIIGEICFENEIEFSQKPDIIINFSALCAKIIQECDFKTKLTEVSKKYCAPLIFVNQVGAVDSMSFNGGSCVFDKKGKLLANTKYFEEQFLIVNPEKELGRIYQTEKNINNQKQQEEFSLDYEKDLERTYKTTIQGIKDYFSKTGFKRAVLGLSGGLDSTVCAVLLTDALGKENVLGISMPSKITSDTSKNDAKELAQNLGINFTQVPIKDMYEATNNTLQGLFNTIEQNWDCRYKQSYTPDNIQARSRAVILWGVSNEFDKCLPIATSDKSEAYVGYATINGDMSGGFAPIADITKTKLFALAKWLNKNRTDKNAIPESVINKRPGAELAIDPKTGKPLIAEDALMPYEFLDEIIWRIENKKECYSDMINSEFLYEKKNNISKEQKTQWLDKFYRRMAGALYKKTIFPPAIIVDTKTTYKQPITSSSINYKGHTEEEIQKIIEKI